MKLLDAARSAPARYALIFAALSAIVMGILLELIYWQMCSLLENHVEQAIEQQLDVMRDDFSQDGRGSMIGLARQHRERRGESPIHLLIQDSSGSVIESDMPPLQVFEGWQDIDLSHALETGDRAVRIYRGLGTWIDEDTFVLVAHDTADLLQTQSLLVRSFSIALAVTVALSLVGGLAIGDVLLQRVEDVNLTARAFMAGDLSRRIPAVDRKDELGGLAENLNQMLARIEELMENLRHVTSSIAHDLRSPLGRLHQRLEASRVKSCSNSEYEAVIDAAIEDTSTIFNIFDAMLRIAQIESGTPRERFTGVNLSSIAENVYEAFSIVAEDEGKSIVDRIHLKVFSHGDEGLLTQMLVNIIENALRHTPLGTTILIQLEHVAGRPLLTVSDDGPGIPFDERKNVFRRFYRLDASRSTEGSGLGLSFVAAVAKLHDATVALEDNNPGLRVVIGFAQYPQI